MGTAGIRKILVANRGEIALRVMRTCREMGIATVAVYSEVDRNMPHVLQADEAHAIGPAPSSQSYLSMETIIATALRAGADAIHPGYGFLSENPEFAQRVRDAGLIFIGPLPSSIRAMGDKTEARRLVRAHGVPTVPGTDGPITAVSEAEEFLALNGFPVLLKAAAGGGGKGMRIVHSAQELPDAFRGAQSEAASAFGDGRVYVEKYLDQPRHIEFQILADRHGNTIHLGERECSIQRRHQKIIEESPSVIVDAAMRETMGRTAVMAAQACRYENAGTIEFLVDRGRNFYFLEMNTRLQVEHPVTEERTGIDLVAEQIRIAAGETLRYRQEDIQFRGHAIECRICAEDPSHDFLPSIGRILHLRPAQGPGVREDRGIDEGGEVSLYYDSMISKLIVHAQDRHEAIERMKRALREYRILGVSTNIPVCLFVLEHPAFTGGDFSTHFLQEHYSPAGLATLTESQAHAVAAVCTTLELARQNSTEMTFAGNGRPRPSPWKLQRNLSMRS